MVKKSRRTTQALAKLLEIVRDHQRVIVVGHDNPDPDFLACALAMKFIAKTQAENPTVITFGGVLGRAENKTMVRLLKLNLTPIENVRFTRSAAVILIDTQPGTGNNSLPKGIRPDAVIDHHPRRRSSEAKLVDIRTDFGATSTILADYLLALEVDLPPPLATALAYGIASETLDLSRETGEHDIQAYLWALARANKRHLAQITHPKVSRYYFATLGKALKNAFCYRTIIGARLGEIEQPDVVAQIADLFLSHERMTWAICSGFFGDQLLVSVRSSHGRANLGALMRRLVDHRGTAGGHELSAGAQIDCRGMVPAERMRLEETFIRNFMHHITHQKEVEPKPLILEL